MTKNPGERLFEAIGQIPDELVLEAEQEQLSVLETVQEQPLAQETGQEGQAAPKTGQEWTAAQETGQEGQQVLKTGQEGQAAPKTGQERTAAQGTGQEKQPVLVTGWEQPSVQETGREHLTVMEAEHGHLAEDAASSQSKKQRFTDLAVKLGGYLKYLPVAACLCIVFFGTYYMINYMGTGKDAGFSMSGGSAQTSEDSAFDGENNKALESDSGGQAVMEDTAESGEGSEAVMDTEAERMPFLPERYGAYVGPVLPVTATGDIQKLRTSRTLKGSIVTEDHEEGQQPLFKVTDSYKIKNTSSEDKTLQVLYPFVAVLNQAQDIDGEILQISGQAHPVQVTYSLGDSIAAYENLDSFTQALSETSMKEYQEQALEKEADWDREVSVYTFSDIRSKGEAETGQTCVAGITVYGPKAQVLTLGFDHSFELEDGVANYCFFVPQEKEPLYLIVAGEMEGEPEINFYTNLDCEETVEGMEYEMDRRKLSYTDALHLCSSAAAEHLKQKYEQGISDARLPEYMDADAAFQALTMISEEDDFYDTLKERYDSTELGEIFNRIFGETRIVYAKATVTIPAKQSVQVTAQTQKQQEKGHYRLMNGNGESKSQYRYDFLSSGQSRLQIKKTSFRLELPGEWQIAGEDMELEQKRDTVWKAVWGEDAHYFTLEK